MQCTTCGNDNPPEARFCARCGTALAAAGPSVPAPSQQVTAPSVVLSTSPTSAHASVPIPISSILSAVGLVLPGLIVGDLIRDSDFRYGYHDVSFIGFAWLGLGVGFAAALWLSSSLQMRGRLLSALGIVLILVGIVIGLGFGFYDNYTGAMYFYTIANMIRNSIFGLGIGLLFPVTFWWNLLQMSPGGKAVQAVSAIAGLLKGWTGFWEVDFLLIGLIALFIGWPLAEAEDGVQKPPT